LRPEQHGKMRLKSKEKSAASNTRKNWRLMKVGTDNRRNLYNPDRASAGWACMAASTYYFGKPTVSANTPVPGVTAPAAKKPVGDNSYCKEKGKYLLWLRHSIQRFRLDLLSCGAKTRNMRAGKRNIFQSQMERYTEAHRRMAGRRTRFLRPPPPQSSGSGARHPPPPNPAEVLPDFPAGRAEAKQAFLSSGDDCVYRKRRRGHHRR